MNMVKNPFISSIKHVQYSIATIIVPVAGNDHGKQLLYLLQAGLLLQNPFAEKKGRLYLLPTLLKT